MKKEEYILKKSNKKGKRYEIVMPSFGHSHSFGSKEGQTYIDHKNEDKKNAWKARHKVNPNYNSKHSGIYHSRKLLWEEPSLDKAIKKYEKEHNVKIINKIKK